MFILKVKTDNAAFEPGSRGMELARILHGLAETIEGTSGGSEECDRRYHPTDEDLAECDKFYREECDSLDSGELIALTVDVLEPCGGVAGQHCATCQHWNLTDEPIGGIVLDNSIAAVEEYVKEEHGGDCE